MNPEPNPRPMAGNRWLQVLAGPLFTLAWAAGLEALRSTPFHLPGLGVSLMVAVAGSTFTGGILPGLLSAAVTVAYGVHFYGSPPEGMTPEDVRHILDLAVGSGLIVLMLGVMRRRAERAHRQMAEAAVAAEYRIVFEEAADPVLLADASGRYVFVNRRACELTGYAREELLRMTVGELFVQDIPKGERQPSGSPEPSRVHAEVELLHRDGRRLCADISVRHLSDGRTLSIVRDVTEQREAVERLQRALSLVNATLDSTTDGILIVDREGGWVSHNRRFAEIWNIPGDIASAGEDERALNYVLDQLADPEDFIARVRRLYATPDAISHDEIAMKDGRTLERYSIPQRIDDRTVGRVWNFRDVTEARRLAAEKREAEERFIQTEKLEAVGRLAGGFAHDFNNMLTAILGEADLLLLQASLEGRPRAQVENIRSAALRSARLTRQLLAFARRQHAVPQPFAISEVLIALDPLIRRLAGRKVDVRLELPDHGAGPTVHADPAQFEQALLNLVINAGDAMPDGGSLELSLCRDTLSEAEAARRGAPAPGVYACVCVTDTGTGIPDDVKPHLFEPFFTTKPPGQGTGLGLASVHGVVRQANGFVEVRSEVGSGSTFQLWLPEYIRTAPKAPGDGQAAEEPTLPRAASILVVDDEPPVRTIVLTVLRSAGYEVVAAGSASAALEFARSQPGPFELLLSDVVMPGTSGPALARTLLAEGRVRRVMFMSGYTGRMLEEDLGDLGDIVVVNKPFRSHELLEQVRLALEGTETSLPG